LLIGQPASFLGHFQQHGAGFPGGRLRAVKCKSRASCRYGSALLITTAAHYLRFDQHLQGPARGQHHFRSPGKLIN